MWRKIAPGNVRYASTTQLLDKNLSTKLKRKYCKKNSSVSKRRLLNRKRKRNEDSSVKPSSNNVERPKSKLKLKRAKKKLRI